MKLLIILSLILLVGCDQVTKLVVTEGKLVTKENLRYFADQCYALAKCMGAKGEVIYMPKQTNDPYACNIQKKGKTRNKGRYFYPKAGLTFGEIKFDGFENEITVCELTNETGRASDAAYAQLDIIFKHIDEVRAEARARNNKQAEAIRHENEPVKVKVVE